jgi:tRNA pseudouridine38-40 synthase
MQRYKFVVAYVGNQFNGSQRQLPNYRTVQSAIEEALHNFSSQSITAHLAGRTDAGVHALAMSGHFDLQRVDRKTGLAMNEPYPASVIMKALNAKLAVHKGAVSLLEVQCVPTTFHARHSASRRTYLYCIRDLPCLNVADRDGIKHAMIGAHASKNSKIPPNVFEDARAWNLYDFLDVDKMRAAATEFCGTHDFTSFRSVRCGAKNPVRTIREMMIYEDPETVESQPWLQGLPHVVRTRRLWIRISSEAFLYHQIRNMVAVLVEVGRGNMVPSDVKRILEARDRKYAPAMAPADGLYFAHVDYAPEAYEPTPDGRMYRAFRGIDLDEEGSDSGDADEVGEIEAGVPAKKPRLDQTS